MRLAILAALSLGVVIVKHLNICRTLDIELMLFECFFDFLFSLFKNITPKLLIALSEEYKLMLINVIIA